MHTKPEFITFVGVDRQTDLIEADKLACEYPIEWGVLFPPNNNDVAYPSIEVVEQILNIGGRKSAHLCFDIADEVVSSGSVPASVPLAHFERVQINARGQSVPEGCFKKIQDNYGVQAILQLKGSVFNPVNGFQQIYDCSDGTGKLPEKVPPHPDGKTLVGYAGGIGPDTVSQYMEMIDKNGPFWIDMQSRIRTNGWFDLEKVRHVCELVYG